MAENMRKSIIEMNELVEQLYHQGQFDEALVHALEASEKARRYLSQEDLVSYTALFNLASLYFTIGDYEQAEPLYKQVLSVQRSLLGDDHPSVTTTMNNLASLYYMTGDYEQAEDLYLQVLQVRRSTLSEQHPDVATSINNLAALYYARGDYEQAQGFFLDALAIQRQAVKDANHHVSTTLNNLAALYESLGDYEQAQSSYQQALETMRIAVGEKHPDVAKLLNNLGQLAYTQGDFAKAEAFYEQALSIQQAVWSKPHPDRAKTLGNLAVLYTDKGDYEQAAQFHNQALEIKKQFLGEEHPEVATSLDNLGVLYKELGRYQEAEPLCLHALDIRMKTLGKNHPEVAKSLYNLGALRYATGRYEQAKSLYEQALEIQRVVLGELHPDTAITLNSLAVLYRDRGHYDQAEALYQQALAIQQEVLGEQHPDVATTLGNLAGLYREMGDYQQAESLGYQSLEIEREILGNEHPHVATSLNNLAVLYYVQENYERAESLYQQALEIRRAALGEQHPDVAGSLINLAMLSYSTGRYEQAVQHCLQALEIERAALGEEHPEVLANLSNLAVLYYAIGAHERAIFYGQQGYELQSALLGDQHPDVGGAMSNLAVNYAATGRQDKALHLMQQVAVIDDHMVEQIFSISSERQRLSYLSTLQGDMDALLSLVLQSFSTDPEAIEAATNLVLQRKAVTIEVLAAQQEARLGERYPQLTPQFQELADLRTQITQKVLAGPEQGEDSQRYQVHLNTLNAQKEKLETYIARRIPEMRISHRTQHVTHQKIAKALPPESALVEFVRFEVFDFQAVPAHGDSLWMPARYLAFVILAGEPDFVQMIDLGEADRLDAMLAEFRATITGETEGSGFSPSPPSLAPDHKQQTAERQLLAIPTALATGGNMSHGLALRKTVFDPLIEALRGRTRLFFAPDGNLTRLPFEILPADVTGGGYLIEKYQISYLGTGRDILRSTGRQRKPAPPLVVADPDFDLGNDHIPSKAVQFQETPKSLFEHNSPLFGRLLGTLTEGRQIGALLGVEPLLGENALETTIKACHSPRILHIATHGFFLPNQTLTYNPKELVLEGRLGNFVRRSVDNPLLRSGLALAGANTWNRREPLPLEAEDGLLTAEDVSGLDLLDTELVVLSACETGLGEVHIGEGVFGLRRAFTLAGAHTLIMSLWKVPDEQTQELMADFYHRVLSGQHYAEALRAAQLAVKSKYTHPFYWGAFICQGTPDLGTLESRRL